MAARAGAFDGMEFHQLRDFCAVAGAGNFTRKSREILRQIRAQCPHRAVMPRLAWLGRIDPDARIFGAFLEPYGAAKSCGSCQKKVS